MSLKDKVEGNELDLSLNQLTDVPVKELVAASKATHLDLSCNHIQSLPNDFATLTHLVKIDLSRNKLTELPHNFGNLINLQFLDLDRNELRNLPISFCRLRNLRWLDLKDNPLETRLKAVAGDCLDEKQCQACAKKVVAYMQSIDSNLEREKQKKLKEDREKEAIEKARVEKELEEHRRLKKLEKERRKAESRARNEERLRQDKENIEKESSFSETESRDDLITEDRKGVHWCTWFVLFLFFIIAISIFFMSTVKDSPIHRITMSDIKSFAEEYSLRISKFSVKFWNSTLIPLALSIKASVLRNTHSIMLYISKVASDIEMYLHVYF